MENYILITGASGLLGKALVRQFAANGFHVFAQYREEAPWGPKNCQWIQADFSSLTGIRDFLIENSLRFKRCGFLVNNYGPITYKDITDLTSDDFYYDFHHNVITAFEVTSFFIKYTRVQAVVNIGFEGVGAVKPYQKILTYAAAKNALQLMTESFAARYQNIRFQMVSPATMIGAEVKSTGGEQVSPQSVARQVYEKIIK
jgi:NAD(P)-dependent dehydrogenase (short-subunit alcohol dehydrogenase family)